MRKPGTEGKSSPGRRSGPGRGSRARAKPGAGRGAGRRVQAYMKLLRLPGDSPLIGMSDRPFTGDLLWVPFPGPWSERMLKMLLGGQRARRFRIATSA